MVNLFALTTAMLAFTAYAARKEDQVTSLPKIGRKDLPTKWYSGYLKTTSPRRKLHYVYIESQSKPSSDPVLVWFNGGPGCSSMLGLIQEHGPFVIDDFETTVKENPYPWNKRANMLYLESPGGVGFSFAETKQDLSYTDHSQSVDAFAAIRDFYDSWPELLKNKLYITGESYGGIYAPFLALQIHEWNEEVKKSRMHHHSPNRQIYPLNGFIIGNGATDWRFDADPQYHEVFYKFGHINDTIYNEFVKLNCSYFYRSLIKVDNDPKCDSLWHTVIRRVTDVWNIYDLQRKVPVTQSSSERVQEKRILTEVPNKNFLYMKHMLRSDPLDTPYVTEYLNSPEVRKALHIPSFIPPYEICNDTVLMEYTSQLEGSVWIYPIMLKYGYRLMHYSGNTDGAIPTKGTKAWIEHHKFQETKAQRPYYTDGEFTGHLTEYGNFVFATVNGTGHMAPQWKRKEVTQLISRFIHEEQLDA